MEIYPEPLVTGSFAYLVLACRCPIERVRSDVPAFSGRQSPSVDSGERTVRVRQVRGSGEAKRRLSVRLPHREVPWNSRMHACMPDEKKKRYRQSVQRLRRYGQ